MQTPPTFDFAAMQGSFKLPPPIFIQHKSQDFGMLEIEKIDSSYNKRTGRPIRKSAGRRSIAAGFVNSVEAIELDPNETWFVEQDTTEDADSDNERPKKKARTKRLPSPPLPPLSPMMKEDYPTPDSSPVPEERPEISPPVALPLTLSLNIPPSFQGGVLNINVDLGSLLLQQSNDYRHTDFKRQTASPISDYGCDESCTNLSSQRTGFLDLPGELRNKVYRLAFVTPDTIESNSKGWARSGQFLATCRTVYEEGRSILYGENKFLFERTNKTRGAYYDAVHKEIGYKDVRRFFESIGPSNTALLRDLSFTFDDAMPSMTPYLSSNEVSSNSSLLSSSLLIFPTRSAALHTISI